jgi:NAD-dependent dihydropyrimidine dehydrogenase PreA subunit
MPPTRTEPNCKQPPGLFAPVVNGKTCEAKGDCERVCPYDVFTVRTLTAQERGAMSPLGRLKLFVHGGKQAFVTAPDQCHACGLCVTACPENAITLARLG